LILLSCSISPEILRSLILKNFLALLSVIIVFIVEVNFDTIPKTKLFIMKKDFYRKERGKIQRMGKNILSNNFFRTSKKMT
jgi:hypothetical protein